MKVIYVGNCGYLVQSGDQKIAIDAFIGGIKSEYYDFPPDSVVALMTAAAPPFDSIDILAVTHWHDDHFSAPLTAQYLMKNTQCTLICSQQVADRLSALPEFAKISSRIEAVDVPFDSVATYERTGMAARMLMTHHGPYHDVDSTGQVVDIHRLTQNLEFCLVIGDLTVFHCGDAAMNERYRYQRLGIDPESDSVDIAFVQRWTCAEQVTFREHLVRKDLRPRYVFFTHMAPGFGAQAANRPTCANYRNVIFATHSLQAWTIDSIQSDR